MQNATKALFLLCALSVSMAQVSEKVKFNVRVLRVSRVGRTGCTADVASAKVRYTIFSGAGGACAMLRAGEEYRASLGSGRPSGKDDDADDVPQMVIENNLENLGRRNAVFEINIQEVLDFK